MPVPLAGCAIGSRAPTRSCEGWRGSRAALGANGPLRLPKAAAALYHGRANFSGPSFMRS